MLCFLSFCCFLLAVSSTPLTTNTPCVASAWGNWSRTCQKCDNSAVYRTRTIKNGMNNCTTTNETVTCAQRCEPCAKKWGHCKNGGLCSLIGEARNAHCVCPAEWSGPRCEMHTSDRTTACSSYPCKHGTCYLDNKTANITAFCKCKSNYFGEHCEQISPCAVSNPCKNGGTCTATGGQEYICTCTRGWGGANCSGTIVNPCGAAICTEKDKNATCAPKFGRPYCYCSKGWYGARCNTTHQILCLGEDECCDGSCVRCGRQMTRCAMNTPQPVGYKNMTADEQRCWSARSLISCAAARNCGSMLKVLCHNSKQMLGNCSTPVECQVKPSQCDTTIWQKCVNNIIATGAQMNKCQYLHSWVDCAKYGNCPSIGVHYCAAYNATKNCTMPQACVDWSRPNPTSTSSSLLQESSETGAEFYDGEIGMFRMEVRDTISELLQGNPNVNPIGPHQFSTTEHRHSSQFPIGIGHLFVVGAVVGVALVLLLSQHKRPQELGGADLA